jgi:hypothetical protein
MKGSSLGDLAREVRPRSLFQDPVRLGCLASIGVLLFTPDVPFWLTLTVIAVLQLAPVLMAARGMAEGWSRRWGPKVHDALFASSLSVDFTQMAACAVTGAMLLVRHFNGVEVLRPLSILGAAICFLPEARLCRAILAAEPVEATRQLRTATFLRDPAMLAALLASTVICLLDRTSLWFLMISLGFLQLNAILVFVDKHLPEIEMGRSRGWVGLILEREGRRFLLLLASLALVPLRVFAGDRPAWMGAAAIAAVIVLPSLYQLLLAGMQKVGEMFRVTPPPPPHTYVVLPKA